MKKQTIKNLVHTVAMLAMCLLLLALPAGYGRWSDTRLLHSVFARPQLEGVLDQQAQQIPVLYALYRKRYLEEEYHDYVDYSNSAEKQMQLQRMAEAVENLGISGVLPQTLAERLAQQLEKSEQVSVWRQTGGFVGSSAFVAKIGWQGSSCTIEQFEETGQVTHLVCPIEPWMEISPQEVMEHYRSYLGLLELKDWEWKNTANPNQAGMWSDQGQIYLYCNVEEPYQMLTLGAFSIDPEQFRTSYLEKSPAKALP